MIMSGENNWPIELNPVNAKEIPTASASMLVATAMVRDYLQAGRVETAFFAVQMFAYHTDTEKCQQGKCYPVVAMIR